MCVWGFVSVCDSECVCTCVVGSEVIWAEGLSLSKPLSLLWGGETDVCGEMEGGGCSGGGGDQGRKGEKGWTEPEGWGGGCGRRRTDR